MRRLSIVFISIAVSFFSSCEIKQFDVDVLAGDPELVLICCPGTRDTTIIQLYKTIPVGDNYYGFPFLDSAEIVFRINGVKEAVIPSHAGVGSVPEGCWFVPRRLEPGSLVEIEAEAEDMGPVSSSTRIPVQVKDFEYELDLYSAQDATHLRISFDDTPGVENYYGVGLLCERTVTVEEKVFVETYMMKPSTQSSERYLVYGFNGWTFSSWWYSVSMVPDKTYKDGRIQMSMDLLDSSKMVFTEKHTETHRYKVCVYSFSREFYEFVLSMSQRSNNTIAESGFAMMPLNYTNINGGSGVLAGWTMSETDWINE